METPQLVTKKVAYATWRSLFILSFEFEYRTIRTIKRDTNGELGWFQVLIIHLSKTLILTPREVTCSCFASADCCSEVPKIFSEVPTVRATVCRVFKSRKFRDFSRRFRTLEYSRYCSGSGGIYTPQSPNGYLLPPLAQNAVPTVFSHLAFTPNLLSSKSLPSID